MALRWFLQVVSTKMVGHPNSDEADEGFQTKLVKGIRPMGVREVEAMKPNSNKKTCGLNGRVNIGAKNCSEFQMPLHYPRYKEEDYQRMEEWKLDMLLKEYGLACDGFLEEKRAYAIGTFLWPDQLQGDGGFTL